MEIIVKGSPAECDKVRKCISEISTFETQFAPLCKALLGMEISSDFSNIFLNNVRYVPEGGAE